MRAEWFEFTPEFKVFFATNHKPMIRGTEHAIWRRVRLIPFTVAIPDEEQDRELGEKLKAEAPGILRWAVEGCLGWQRDGLGAPDEITDATAAYREEMDVLGEFLRECCIVDPNARVGAGNLYQRYVEWCGAMKEHPLTQTAFGRQLGERDFAADRTKAEGRTRRGLRLRIASDPEAGDAFGQVTGGDGFSALSVTSSDSDARADDTRRHPSPVPGCTERGAGPKVYEF
jgi:putative DNA primase/helicase